MKNVLLARSLRGVSVSRMTSIMFSSYNLFHLSNQDGEFGIAQSYLACLGFRFVE